MDPQPKFYLMTSGNIRPGFEWEEVESHVAKLFKVSREKARGIVSSKRVLKKDLDQKKAQLYQQRLEGIGVEIRLVESAPTAKAASAPAKETAAAAAPAEKRIEQPAAKQTRRQAEKPAQSKADRRAGGEADRAPTSAKPGPGDAGGATAPNGPAPKTGATESKRTPQAAAAVAEAPATAQQASPPASESLTQKPQLNPGPDELAPEPKLGGGVAPIPDTELALAPISSSARGSAQSGGETIACPKCGMKQATAEQCASCGVYLHKLAEAPELERDSAQEPPPNMTIEQVPDESMHIMALVATAVVAAGGAFAWKMMVLTTGYEYGVAAWVIGGAIGLAAAIAGAGGQTSGAVCGVLALLAIIGGKYLAYQTIQTDLDVMLTQIGLEMEDMRPAYDELLYSAEVFSATPQDDASVREFMVDHGYTDAFVALDVSAEELDYFRSFTVPELNSMALSPPGFEQWINTSFQSEISSVSTIELLMEDLGLIDIVFLFLGIGTAFRLGSGESATF